MLITTFNSFLRLAVLLASGLASLLWIYLLFVVLAVLCPFPVRVVIRRMVGALEVGGGGEED